MNLSVRAMIPDDFPAVRAIWNACVSAGEALYYPLTEDYFRRKFVDNGLASAGRFLVAEANARVVGFIHGVAPESFPGAKPGNAYLTCLMVSPECRRAGAGAALLAALRKELRAAGGQTLFISSVNPVNLDWRIPGTPGHDHNNMPGLDEGCEGYGFFAREGFEARYRETAMYVDLSGWRVSPEIAGIRARLASEGIFTGEHDCAKEMDFDGMCDRVGSDYWRDALRTEIAAHRVGRPNADARFWADGARPAGPRPLLTAVRGNAIVGFTGPVDLQKSGRGWFTGICTDPLYGGRGIATVLFSLLMQAFVAEGARFTTLFTGLDNPARKVYLRAGLKPVRGFALMSAPL